ncbi:MAG: hypothetical protein PHE59_04485 [Patescibacteria group bacterium]|nr:hypothetical protein [Patescibacteria group bacterium]MDD5164570.1 hypothetical protein [Patescibacteria group bacterium]MDD5534305.1 hypothetical protein [Patescibacteria group bacterium]
MKKVILIIVILVLIGGTVWFLMSKKSQPILENKNIINQLVDQENTVNQNQVETETLVPTAEDLLKIDLTNQARSFIERYGSYSTDSNYENLQELLPKMAQPLRTETESRIQKGVKKDMAVNDFFGLTTKIISINLDKFVPDSQAIFTAEIQEQAARLGQTDILYKTVKLTFIKSADEWKVGEIEIH